MRVKAAILNLLALAIGSEVIATHQIEKTPHPVRSSNQVGKGTRGVGRADALQTLSLVRVRFQRLGHSMRQQIMKIETVREMTGRSYDLLATGQAGRFLILDAQGLPLLSVPFSQPSLVVRRIAAETQIRRLLQLSNPHADFRLDLHLRSKRRQAEFRVGDEVTLRLLASRDSYLMLLYADPLGNLSVLYPAWPEEQSIVPAGEEVLIPGLFIPSPQGRSFFQAFAFADRPQGYESWKTGEEIRPSTLPFEEMMQFLEAHSGLAAQSRLQIVTRK